MNVEQNGENRRSQTQERQKVCTHIQQQNSTDKEGNTVLLIFLLQLLKVGPLITNASV